VLFGAGRQRALDVLGEFSDDVPRDITAAVLGTEYHSSNTAIVTVSPDGVLTSTGPGVATVSVRNGPAQDSISVTVKPNRAPVARAGTDVSSVCVVAGAKSSVQLDGSTSFDPEGDPLSFSWFENDVLLATGPTPVVELDPGDHQIALVVSDGFSSSAADTVEVSLLADTDPPAITCPADPTIECSAHSGVASFEAASIDNCTLASEACIPASGSSFALGSTLDTCTASDTAGNSSSCTFHVNVRDTEPPTVVTRPHRVILWPPDHTYRTFKLSDCVNRVTDACEGDLDIDAVGKITRVTSDEPERQGHGHHHHLRDHTCNDIVITGDSTVQLRAEREAFGNGRVYTVFFDVTDPSGNVRARSCQIAVPHVPFLPAIENSCHLCEGSGCGSCPHHDPACH
jgi:hypothetical protein